MKRFLPLMFLFFLPHLLLAGVTGKIAGIITDATTGEPLPGVNVILKGTSMGAASDMQGYYVILNIPPGTYTLEASFVGYKNVVVNEVVVNVDLTTRIDIKMEETTLETSEAITVIASRPMIRKDEVSTRHFVSSQDMELQPITSFKEAAQFQPGVVGTHFRGGRAGEVLVLIDGIPVRDPAGTYSGSFGGFTSDVPKLGIEQMEVSLGGFSAEYGNVQSGILNLALKEGSKDFSGRLRFSAKPGFGATTSFTEHGYRFKLLQPLENYYEGSITGPLYKNKISFSASAQIIDQNQGFYPNENSYKQNYQGKLTFKFSPNLKLSVGTVINRNEWDNFYFPASKYGPGPNYQKDTYYKGVRSGTDTLEVYRYVFDKNLYGKIETKNESGLFDSTAYNVVKTYYMAGMQEYLWHNKQASNLFYLTWTHSLSAKTFYEIRLNSFYSNYHYATRDIEDRDGDGDRNEDLEWDISKPGPHPIYREREDNFWWLRGDDPGYRDQKSWTQTLKADLVSQINSNHLLKGGVQLDYHTTKVENISWTLGVGIYRYDVWTQNSLDFGAYIQDKIEYQGIIGLVGLRFDAFDPNGLYDDIYYPADYANPFITVGPDGIPILQNPKKASIKYQFSPRIGISHPITEKSILHFTYGHYFQRPDGYFLYRNHYLQSLTKVGNYVGNPDLSPEKTVAYEIGVEQQIGNDYKITLTGYYKDITNLMNYYKYVARSVGDRELNVYMNADYGNSKGFEVTFSRRMGKFFGGNLNYTYSIAKGRSSSASGGANSWNSVKRMNYLSFDQTHTVNAILNFRTPEDFGTLIGSFHPFGNWMVSMLFKYGSGLPYSSYGTDRINDKRMPATHNLDLKLMKELRFSARYGMRLFVDVFNVYDRHNVRFIGDNQYYELGDPNDPTIKGDPSVIWREADGSYVRTPLAYSPGRYIRLGFELFF
ncbi:TonB-dependent receptor [Caldithrix abyssi DSM 13497]|uniref:TonB-dependent receptor n=2 Tax=Caldithrix abyssi DSM 13497 TaxID=880073 RepID=H1XQN2_CALAY|nr:TonB-dependent receptor [Caldithrix abyssi]EHO41178.1 TonB-dependent receptor [Caldithrix abyssi DSM 13497]